MLGMQQPRAYLCEGYNAGTQLYLSCTNTPGLGARSNAAHCIGPVARWLQHVSPLPHIKQGTHQVAAGCPQLPLLRPRRQHAALQAYRRRRCRQPPHCCNCCTSSS